MGKSWKIPLDPDFKLEIQRLKDAGYSVSALADEYVDGSLKYADGADFEPPATKPDIPARRQLLEESAGLIDGDRNKNYGSPVENFRNTAKLLTARFEHKLKDGETFTADDVATIQILTKISRMITSPEKKDHWLDIAGYAGCGWECIEEGHRET